MEPSTTLVKELWTSAIEKPNTTRTQKQQNEEDSKAATRECMHEPAWCVNGNLTPLLHPDRTVDKSVVFFCYVSADTRDKACFSSANFSTSLESIAIALVQRCFGALANLRISLVQFFLSCLRSCARRQYQKLSRLCSSRVHLVNSIPQRVTLDPEVDGPAVAYLR